MKLFLLVCSLLLGLSSPATGQGVGVVPGCDCPLSACSSGRQFLAPCLEVNEELFPDFATNDEDAICDSLDNSTEFQAESGVDAEPFVFSGGGFTTGPWLRSGDIVTVLAPRTCEEAIARQLTCPLESKNESVSTSSSDPNGCGGFQSGDEEGIIYFLACKASFEPALNEPGLEVYMALGATDDEDICDEDFIASTTPVLTSSDWIEPEPGRRYMCTEKSTTNGQIYSALVMNFGNPPCTIVDEEPTGAPTQISSASNLFNSASLWGCLALLGVCALY